MSGETQSLDAAKTRYLERLEEASRLQAEAKAEWVDAVRDAVAESNAAAVAEQLGVSRQRVAVLVRGD